MNSTFSLDRETNHLDKLPILLNEIFVKIRNEGLDDRSFIEENGEYSKVYKYYSALTMNPTGKEYLELLSSNDWQKLGNDLQQIINKHKSQRGAEWDKAFVSNSKIPPLIRAIILFKVPEYDIHQYCGSAAARNTVSLQEINEWRKLFIYYSTNKYRDMATSPVSLSSVRGVGEYSSRNSNGGERNRRGMPKRHISDD